VIAEVLREHLSRQQIERQVPYWQDTDRGLPQSHDGSAERAQRHPAGDHPPTGDAEMLDQIRNRCHTINTRVAGVSCRLHTTFPRT
jgi:hypothetical protein